MAGAAENLLGGSVLGAPAGVHDQDVVRELGHHPEIVRDDDDRGAELLLQIRDEVEDLRLHRDIQRGGGLVGDQQPGSQDSAMAIITRWRMPPENWYG